MISLTPALFAACVEAAHHFRLPDELLVGIVRVESSGITDCNRFEPNFRYFWDNAKNAPFSVQRFEMERTQAPSGFAAPKGIASSVDTEWNNQRTSWGPMQIMGATAREIGYLGWLPALCREDAGVHWGALYLRRLAREHFEKHGWEGVAAAYNAGSPRKDDAGRWVNQKYIDKLVAVGVGGGGVDFAKLPTFFK